MVRNRNNLFNKNLKRASINYNNRSNKNGPQNWFKGILAKALLVSLVFIIALTIETLNYEKPKQALNLVKSKLEMSEGVEFYLTKAKKLTSYIYEFGNKAVTAIKIEDTLNKNFIPPIDGEITTYFNENVKDTSNICKGLIFTSSIGENIYSIDEGVVIDLGSNKSIGNYIIIKHRGELLSIYKYVGNNGVALNQRVEQGQIIGTSSEKLLLEVWYRKEPIDPLKYIGVNTLQL